jgi:hypothetical protein
LQDKPDLAGGCAMQAALHAAHLPAWDLFATTPVNEITVTQTAGPAITAESYGMMVAGLTVTDAETAATASARSEAMDRELVLRRQDAENLK